MTLAVHHLAVVVADLARAEHFYCGVLGLTVQKRWDDAVGAPRSIWVTLANDAFLAIEKATSATPQRSDEAPGWHCVALRIARAEREAWRARFESNNVEVVRETSYTLYVRDPDGNLLGLSHYPET